VSDASLTRDAMLAYLGDKLPTYMMPSAFWRISAIPMTANGKVDRKQLTETAGEPLGGSFVKKDEDTLSDIERALAGIWAELLPVKEIGTNDNFFELGGHSLKATQAVSRIRQRLAKPLTLRDFFSAPTLGALASLLSRQKTEGFEPIGVAAPAEDYPLSFAQRRLWVLQTQHPDQINYNMAGGFWLHGDLNVKALGDSFAALVARHESLRTRFITRHGEPRQIIDASSGSFPLDVEMSDTLMDSATLLDAELHHVFRLDEGPLLRVRLYRMLESNANSAPQVWLLVLNMHHIIADGWSVPVMLNDLRALYSAALDDPKASPTALASQLPPLPLQYKDYTLWQRKDIMSDAATAARNYWLKRFEDGAPVLELPYDKTRKVAPTHRGGIASVTFGASLSEGLRAFAVKHDVSLFMVMTALVQLQMHLLSGQPDIVIGTPVAGRQHIELEHQIGLYLNLLPLRLAHDGEQAFSQLLAAARTTVLEALQHQSLPFDCLVEAIGITPMPSRQPLFDVLLILQNNAAPHLDLRGLRSRILADVTVSAKYDLNYMIEDRTEIELLLEYSSDLFDHETAVRMAEEFVAIAAAVVETPGMTATDVAKELGRSTTLVASATEQLFSGDW
jgi:acyl carrier protein